MATQRILFDEWLPDQPSVSKSVREALNVVPVLNGYAYINTAANYSAQASENLNNVFAGKFGGTVTVFAGGATKLFKLDNTDLSLDDVSTAGGYSGDGRWQFVQFGQNMLASNGTQRIQYWTLGSSTGFYQSSTFVSGTYSRSGTAVTATITAHGLTAGETYEVDITSGDGTDGEYVISVTDANTITYTDTNSGTTSGNIRVITSAAPIAKHLTVIRDFVVGAYIEAGTYPNRVQWSDVNDPRYWDSDGASLADFQDIEDGGDITGITGGEFGIILMENAIVRMSFVGSPNIFQFDTIARGVGCIEAGSVTQYAGTTYFLGADGFYACDGQQIIRIGAEKVNRYFFSNANIGDIDSISASIDPERNVVMWDYSNTSGGRSLIIYNYQTQKWSEAETDVDYLSTLSSTGATLDGLDDAYNVTAGSFVIGQYYTIREVGTTDFTLIGAVANTVGVLFQATGAGTGTGVAIDQAAATAGLVSLDALSASLDDRIWKGGKFLFGGVRDDRIVVFTGTRATATLTTNDIEFGYNTLATLVRPSVDNGSADVQIASRRELNDTINFTTAVSADAEGRVGVRSHGRYHRINVTPTGANWTLAIGLDMDYSQAGNR
jgi:hypothetical protein